jgi:uncharacterized phage infection (PIP) family protein YhgE
MDSDVLEERLANFMERTISERVSCQERFSSRMSTIEKCNKELSEKVSSLDGSILKLSTSVDGLSNKLSDSKKNVGVMYGFWGVVIKSMIPVILLMLTFMFGMKNQQDNLKDVVDSAVSSAVSADE